MLYLASALSLLVCVSFGAYPANYPEHGTDISFHLDSSDPDYDTCQLAGMNENQPLIITPTVDNWNSYLTGCICGGMKDGDLFRIEFEHTNGNSDLSSLNDEETFSGLGLAGRIIIKPKRTVGEIWAKIQPSDYDIAEIVTVTLYRERADENGYVSAEERDTFTMKFVRPIPEPAVEGVFVVRTSKPSGKRDCQSDSSDIASAMAYGDDLYICVIFCNAMCPTEYGNTIFSINVVGYDSSDYEVDLTVSNVMPSSELTCDENVLETYRYVTVSNYDSSTLAEIDVTAVIDSYGVATPFEASHSF